MSSFKFRIFLFEPPACAYRSVSTEWWWQEFKLTIWNKIYRHNVLSHFSHSRLRSALQASAVQCRLGSKLNSEANIRQSWKRQLRFDGMCYRYSLGILGEVAIKCSIQVAVFAKGCLVDRKGSFDPSGANSFRLVHFARQYRTAPRESLLLKQIPISSSRMHKTGGSPYRRPTDRDSARCYRINTPAAEAVEDIPATVTMSSYLFWLDPVSASHLRWFTLIFWPNWTRCCCFAWGNFLQVREGLQWLEFLLRTQEFSAQMTTLFFKVQWRSQLWAKYYFDR